MNAHPQAYDLPRLLQLVVYHFSHTFRFSSQQILYYFPVVTKFIWESSPENLNALGFVVLLWQLVSREARVEVWIFLFFFFFVTMKVTFSLKNCHSKRESKRGSVLIQKHLFVLWMMILSVILPAKPLKHFVRKAKLKKKYIRKTHTHAALIISQQNPLSQNHLGMHTVSLSILCTLVCVYRISFWWIILYEI